MIEGFFKNKLFDNFEIDFEHTPDSQCFELLDVTKKNYWKYYKKAKAIVEEEIAGIEDKVDWQVITDELKVDIRKGKALKKALTKDDGSFDHQSLVKGCLWFEDHINGLKEFAAEQAEQKA